jgi:hypothetical protein
MSGGIRRFIKKYALDGVLDSMMCHGDPFYLEHRTVAWMDEDEIPKIWNYVTRYRQEHGTLPQYSEDTMSDIAVREGVSRNAVDRWLSHCLNEAARPEGEQRTPAFRFVDDESHNDTNE